MAVRTWMGVLASAGLGVGTALAQSDAAAGKVEVTTERLCSTALGREVSIMRLHNSESPVGGPALLIVAGIDPRHAGSTDVAKGMVDRLYGKHAQALKRGDVFIVPRLNPDGIEGDRQLARETSRKPAKPGLIDADRDGRFNEDPPVDLDGDGRILWMRVKSPLPGSGLTAEYVLEDGESRLMRKADRGKGERPVYAMLPECRDADGDGLFGEDGLDGVELDRNFPYHWPEFRDEAGRVPLSEPETRALAEWVVKHENVVAVLSYSPADNLVHVPEGEKKDQTGEAPATNRILDGDRGVWERVGEKFKEITRHKEAPTRDNEGSLRGWAYAQMGLWSFSTPVWVRPDQMKEEKKEEPKKEEGKEEKKDERTKEETPKEEKKAEKPPEPPPSEKPKPKKIDNEEGKWMALSDGLVEAGQPSGFVDWKPFKHPQLGDVEIGGFLPGFKTDVRAADKERLMEEQATFVAELLERFPRLAVHGPRVERLGDGVWRVSVEAVNEGLMPTRTEMGVKVHRLPPTRLTIGVERPRILAGNRVFKADAIAAGGTLEGSWTITGRAGETVKIKLESPECGSRELSVVLGDEAKKEGTR